MNSIHLTQKEFHTIKNLVYTTCGINLHEGKLELLKSKIAKRMRITKKNVKDYLKLLASDQREVVEFIDTVTTNHSYFFRENRSIAHIIEQFGKDPKRQTKEFKIWCAAASTGDEPYSAAIQLKNAGLKFSILATDISHTVLQIAEKGIYKNDKIQRIPTALVHRYFQKGMGKYLEYVKVKPEIKTHVAFAKFNLVSNSPDHRMFDAILCRNVMIYFDHQTSENVVNKLYTSLKPGGYFAIGNAESLMNMKHGFQSVPKIPSLYIKPH